MSKRSSNRAGSAARRGPLGLPRIADMRIRSKLGLILLVPLVVLVAVAGLRLYDLADRVFESDDMVKLVEFNTYVAELRYDLQKERSLVVTNLRLDDDHVAGIDKSLYDESSVSSQQSQTDEALRELQRQGRPAPGPVGRRHREPRRRRADAVREPAPDPHRSGGGRRRHLGRRDLPRLPAAHRRTGDDHRHLLAHRQRPRHRPEPPGHRRRHHHPRDPRGGAFDRHQRRQRPQVHQQHPVDELHLVLEHARGCRAGVQDGRRPRRAALVLLQRGRPEHRGGPAGADVRERRGQRRHRRRR